MKIHKETKWLALAVLAFMFIFERSDTLTVQDGYIRLNRRTWWFYEREVKSAATSSIGSVIHSSKLGRKCSFDSLVVKGKDGKIFYELSYNKGFRIGANWWKDAHNDEIVCKRAIAGKCRFSRTIPTTSPLPYAVLMVALVVYWYKRFWRRHEEKIRTSPDPESSR